MSHHSGRAQANRPLRASKHFHVELQLVTDYYYYYNLNKLSMRTTPSAYGICRIGKMKLLRIPVLRLHDISKKPSGCDGSKSILDGLASLLPKVVDLIAGQDIPIILCGGIVDGRGYVLCFGPWGSGIGLVTRFVAIEESYAHPTSKRKLVELDKTEYTDIFGVCGDLEMAWRTFDKMPKKSVVSWNTMISGALGVLCPLRNGAKGPRIVIFMTEKYKIKPGLRALWMHG
ncbi:hypothetical protein IFM89_000060 [Coptis chinensis]|uniref:Uncharacterized protein n=1 Tax=Coptis chinensis TaxID=261450 RepID=A0A835MBW8_9MAGN|nr:hypothetical protein IFM89_000060 [Coptis chinensis]